MKTALVILVQILCFHALASEKSDKMKSFVSDYNKHTQSKDIYLKWLSQYESKENIQFLKDYLAQNPKIELRTLKVVDQDLVFEGKNKYTRLKIVSLKKGEFNIYGKLVRVPLFKPFSSILKNSKKISWLSLFVSIAYADEAAWAGESFDVLTSTRIWWRTTFSNNVYANGRYTTYCKKDFSAVNDMFAELEFNDEDSEDNCHQALLKLGEVVEHYNASMKSYETKNKIFQRTLYAENQSANSAAQESNLSQDISTPSCILSSVVNWKTKYCRQLGRGKFQGCSVIASKPDDLFSCRKSFEATTLPETIGLSIEWRPENYNTEGTPTSRGQR